MPNRSRITVSFPIPLIFRYHLPLRNAFFVGILAAAKKSRILIHNPVNGFRDRIRIKMSRIRKTGYYYSAFISVNLNGGF
jgi:hypothetical protein